MEHDPNEPRRLHLSDIAVLIAAVALTCSAPHAAERLWARRNLGTAYGPGIVKAMMEVLALTAPSVVLLPYQLARSNDRRRLRHGAPGLSAHLAVADAETIIAAPRRPRVGSKLPRRITSGFVWSRKREAIRFVKADVYQNSRRFAAIGNLRTIPDKKP